MQPSRKAIVAVALLLLAALFAGRAWSPKASDGDFGYRPDPDGVRAFLSELDKPAFMQAGADAMQKAQNKDTFLWRAMFDAHQDRYGKPFVVGRQLNGSCVAWGAMHAVYMSESLDWKLGLREDSPLLPSTEALYGGSRVEARGKPGDGKAPYGGWQDGSFGGAAAKFLRDWGVVYRQAYPTCDLTTYNKDTEKVWGAYGCGGQNDDGRMDLEAKKHPCKHIAQVKTWAELVAAIESGYPVTVASNQGFSSHRDKDGFSVAQGVWFHQMMICAVRHKANGSPRDGACVLNSWGPDWNGPRENRWPDDQPDGSFWADRGTIESMLSQDDSYAIGSVEGFKWRDIDHGTWMGRTKERQ